MSRSGYSDDIDNWDLIRWRGMVASAIRGKRGQKFFKDLLAALDSMPEKKLIADELDDKGQVCALGALGRSKGLDMKKFDPYDHDRIAETFDIAPCLSQEVTFENDEHYDDTPENRWKRMRKWVASQIKSDERLR